MKKNEKKLGIIKRFFIWLFRMDGTITEVEVSNEPEPDVPIAFGRHGILRIPKPTVSSVKQNLNKKYNPNVKRGNNGRFQSLK